MDQYNKVDFAGHVWIKLIGIILSLGVALSGATIKILNQINKNTIQNEYQNEAIKEISKVTAETAKLLAETRGRLNGSRMEQNR